MSSCGQDWREEPAGLESWRGLRACGSASFLAEAVVPSGLPMVVTGGDDVEHGQLGDGVGVVQRHPVGAAGAAVVADQGEPIEHSASSLPCRNPCPSLTHDP